MKMVDREIIAILTDFGTKEGYVAAMKGIILKICPKAKIIDISHDIPRHDIFHGAFVLAQVEPYFPKMKTVFIGVVDPGVGTERRGIVIEGKENIFIGPDNGLLSLAAENNGVNRVFEIANPSLMLDKVSHTFHGLTIFAPIAAYIANGIDISSIGPQISDYERITIPQIKIMNKSIYGEVIHIDQFGNIITNIEMKDLQLIDTNYGSKIKINFKGATLIFPFEKSYNYVDPEKTVCVIGSYDYLELSINKGNAAKVLGAEIRDKIIITRFE